ncbi:MAG: HD domain-containing protein [Nanoarchaeota archaeon]|nr:HD domain-containing protein [Nanoarchaeota archaeon]
MEIDDRVYGKEKINESVLIDLILSEPMQRLKGVSQYGLPDEYYHKKGFSRYEHSLGVLVFLRKFGAGLNEQISGLLHDVSHTAFSHVVDWAIGDPEKEDFQDNNHFNVIFNSEIPDILKKYNISSKHISNPENFSLLERHAPSLCADRIDYALRELSIDGESDLAKKFFFSLNERDGILFFEDTAVAESFGRTYSFLNKIHWGGVEARTRYFVMADILRNALSKKIISHDTLYKTDSDVIKILYQSRDKKIISGLNFLKNKKIAKPSSNGDGVHLRKKYRWVDPEVLFKGEIMSLSNVSGKYRDFLREEKTFLEENCYSELLK